MIKNFKYLMYVLRHKWFVFIECCKAGIPLRGILHDLSKFYPDEWAAYRDFFYGNHPRDNVPYLIQHNFDIAWIKHQHRNDHHWQHWVLIEDDGPVKTLRMGYEAEIEMVCDWRGAGKAITGKDNTIQWYIRNKKKMALDYFTRGVVEWKLKLSDLGSYDCIAATEQPFTYPSCWRVPHPSMHVPV